ncbi:peptide-binding protein [Candidatus Marinamargulisbacteria bacterium SCGC AG-343-K17]|nr:peptide-binding protein [Candidatus Marinamargulisbacteria bacterium SCGC AG-343-K17]
MLAHVYSRLAIPILLVFLLISCQPTASKNNNKDLLYLHLGGEPTYLNPILSTDSPSSSVEGLVFSGLFRTDSNLELEPDLLDSYTVNSSGTKYTFKIKKNIRWHDGAPFTVHDIKFTFDKILDKKTNTVRRSNFILDGKPVQFNVVDDYTIEAILPKPFAPFLIRMAMGILPKHILENQDINKSTFNRSPIGTGPYKFKSWESAQYIQLERNDNYHFGPANIKKIIMKIIPDSNTALLALEKGEIDESGIPAKDYSRYSKSSTIDIYRYYDLVYTYLGFNLKHPLFSNRNIRQAIAYAIDKEAIVTGVLKSFGISANIPSSPVLWSYPDEKYIPKFPYNPSKAKQLLNNAGFTLNPKTKILEKDGRPFSFKIITNKGNKNREKSAQIIQRMLSDIGIDVKIQLLEWSSFIKIVNAHQSPKAYDAVILGWSLGLDPDGYSIWHSSQYPKGFNFIGYQNSSVDKLLEKGRTTIDQAKRKSIYKTIYQDIANDVPYLFLYFPETLLGINKRVHGLSDAGPAGIMNPIENVYLVE